MMEEEIEPSIKKLILSLKDSKKSFIPVNLIRIFIFLVKIPELMPSTIKKYK
jgi:hypothetical protein